MSIHFETRGLKDGEWFMLFCSDSLTQERQSTAYVLANWDSPEYRDYEDVRLFYPDRVPSIPRHVGQSERQYLQQMIDAWERRVGRRNVRTNQLEEAA